MNLWTLAYGIFDQDIEEHEIDLQEYLESPPMSAVLEKGTYDFFGVPSPPASDADDESGTEKGEEEEGPGEEGDHSDFPSSGYSEQGAGETEEDKGEEEGEEEEEEQPEEDDDETEVDEPLRRHPSSGTGLRIAMVPFPIYRTHTPPSAASRGKQTSSSRSARRVREKQQATCLKSPDMPSIRGGTTRIRKDSSSNSVSQAIKVLQPQSSPSSPEYRFPTTCGSVAFPVPGPPEDPAAPPHDANCPYCTTSLRVVGVYELFGFTVHISRPAGENACSDSRMESRKRNLIERVGRVMRELEEEEEAMNDKEDAAQGPPVDDTGIGSDDKVSNSQIDGRITRPISVSGRGEAPRREPISEGGQPRGGKESEIDGGGNKRLPSEAELSPGSGKRSNDLSPIITVPPGPKPPRSKKEVTTPPTEPPKQRPGPDAETRTGKDIDIGKPDRQKRPAGPCTSPGPGSPDIPAAAGKPAIQIDRNDITPDTDTGSTPEIRPPESPNPSLVGGSRSRPPRSRTRGTPTRRPLDPSKGKMISGSAGVHNNPTGVDVAPQKKLDVPHRRTSIASTPLDLSSRKPPLPQVIQPPAGTKEESVAAIPESHDALLAQLQTLLLKLHKGSGGVTMLPNLQLQVACEEAELERLEMEMTLVVKVRGTKDMIHMDGGGCETTRELLGFSGGCAMKR
ncbi:hypothetical protein EV426DRAFT_380201 [Tirmania nivea]|nr:hypothetical protein EV426DRAFT_380201 [Tirmania nivea]